MSSTIIDFPKNYVTVMVRAFGGEPVRLRARYHHGQHVEVVGADEEMAIGFPAEDVFDYDETLCGRLKAAFEGGDNSALSALWAVAHQFESA